MQKPWAKEDVFLVHPQNGLNDFILTSAFMGISSLQPCNWSMSNMCTNMSHWQVKTNNYNS